MSEMDPTQRLNPSQIDSLDTEEPDRHGRMPGESSAEAISTTFLESYPLKEDFRAYLTEILSDPNNQQFSIRCTLSSKLCIQHGDDLFQGQFGLPDSVRIRSLLVHRQNRHAQEQAVDRSIELDNLLKEATQLLLPDAYITPTNLLGLLIHKQLFLIIEELIDLESYRQMGTIQPKEREWLPFICEEFKDICCGYAMLSSNLPELPQEEIANDFLEQHLREQMGKNEATRHMLTREHRDMKDTLDVFRQRRDDVRRQQAGQTTSDLEPDFVDVPVLDAE